METKRALWDSNEVVKKHEDEIQQKNHEVDDLKCRFVSYFVLCCFYPSVFYRNFPIPNLRTTIWPKLFSLSFLSGLRMRLRKLPPSIKNVFGEAAVISFPSTNVCHVVNDLHQALLSGALVFGGIAEKPAVR